MTATYVENFQNVLQKQPVLRLVSTAKIEMWVDVPEHLISLVDKVTEVTVRFDAFPDVELRAAIKEVGQEASFKTRTFPVKVVMDQPQNVNGVHRRGLVLHV